MKKIILASVALIAVFASCKKEDIRTVYKANPAEATITVTVFDALYGKDVTSQATVTADPSTSSITVTGNTVKLVGDQAHYNAIPAQKVTIKASFDGREGSVTVPVEGVLEGGVASLSVTVVVGSPIDPTKPVTYDFRNVKTETVPVSYGYLEFATHSHNDSKWVINNSEFFLYGVTEYEHRSGQHASEVNAEGLDGADFDYVMSVFGELSDAHPQKFVKKEFEYNVSAFSYFNVVLTYLDVKQTYECVRINILKDGSKVETVLTTIEQTLWDTKIEPIEMASPDHASHYVQGHGVIDSHYSHYSHGHGHGGMNAGGGIVIAD